MPESNNGNFWNSLLTTAGSMYAQNKKKKDENKQLDWLNSILDSKRNYENDKIASYKSSPGAKMSPMIMEMLVSAYGPRLKKFGIDMPTDRFMGAINGGVGGAGSGGDRGSEGPPVAQKTLSDIASMRGADNQKVPFQDVAQRAGIAYDPKKGYLASDGQYYQTNSAAMNSNRKNNAEGYVMGRVDPGIEGYNGKTWEDLDISRQNILSREDTRKSYGSGEWVSKDGRRGYVGTGATGSLFGYTPSVTNTTQWQDPKIHNSNLDGPGWSENSENSNIDPVSVLSGESSPTFGNGKAELSDITDWLENHKVAGGIAKGLANMFVPGAGTALTKGIEWLVNNGYGDRIKGNGRLSKKKQGGQ